MIISKVAVLIDNSSLMVFVTNTKNLTKNSVRSVVRNYLLKSNKDSKILEIDYLDTYSVTDRALEKLSEEFIVIKL